MTKRDPYIQIEEEISLFIDTIHDPSKASYAMTLMLKTALKIGGKLLEDIEKLEADYRKKPQEKHKIMEDALRIKNEAREL